MTSRVIHKRNYFVNGSSPEINVNGSVTPVEFSIIPNSKETIAVNTFGILILTHRQVDDIEGFGGISGLTNGIEFSIRNGATQIYTRNIKTNADLYGIFPGQVFQEFKSPQHIFNISLDFNENDLIISGRKSQSLVIKIQDNLTTLLKFRSSLSYLSREEL